MNIGATSKQQQLVADTQTNWSQTITFTQFDPVQGRCRASMSA